MELLGAVQSRAEVLLRTEQYLECKQLLSDTCGLLGSAQQLLDCAQINPHAADLFEATSVDYSVHLVSKKHMDQLTQAETLVAFGVIKQRLNIAMDDAVRSNLLFICFRCDTYAQHVDKRMPNHRLVEQLCTAMQHSGS